MIFKHFGWAFIAIQSWGFLADKYVKEHSQETVTVVCWSTWISNQSDVFCQILSEKTSTNSCGVDRVFFLFHVLDNPHCQPKLTSNSSVVTCHALPAPSPSLTCSHHLCFTTKMCTRVSIEKSGKVHGTGLNVTKYWWRHQFCAHILMTSSMIVHAIVDDVINDCALHCWWRHQFVHSIVDDIIVIVTSSILKTMRMTSQ